MAVFSSHEVMVYVQKHQLCEFIWIVVRAISTLQVLSMFNRKRNIVISRWAAPRQHPEHPNAA